jgi:DNA-binding MarR family transcriptional regulator
MGAILRQPHAIHGRIQQIAITQQGKELLSACTKRVLVIQKELLAGFNADEEKIIRRWLVSVAK